MATANAAFEALSSQDRTRGEQFVLLVSQDLRAAHRVLLFYVEIPHARSRGGI